MEKYMVSPSLLGSLSAQVEELFLGVIPEITKNDVTVWEFNSPVISDISVWNYVSVSFWPMPYMEDIYRRYAALINHKRPRKISWRRLNRHQKERAFELYESGRL